ncbi:unnamed protein product [Orchesella dallaii]|uniref:Uncharacterized protein n=1 Tax=Orchesella dallaii TaxID=48710 RepID=A0ABP1Q6U7_9HEXA
MGNAYSDKKVCKCPDEDLPHRRSLAGSEGRCDKANTSSRSSSAATIFKYDLRSNVTPSGDSSRSQDKSVSRKGLGIITQSKRVDIKTDVDFVRFKCDCKNDNNVYINKHGTKTKILDRAVSGPSGHYLRALSDSSSESLQSSSSTSSVLPVHLMNALLTDFSELSLRSNSIEVENNEIENSKTKEAIGDVDLDCIPKNVLYYGWFFTPETSSIINTVVMHFYKVCYNQVSQFQRFILSCCKDADIRDPFEYYKRPGKRVKPDDELKYHITAKFMGRTLDLQYQPLVQPFLKKIFRIHLVGIVFTPKTLGVRVKLTHAQKLVFDEKDEYKTGRKLSISKDDNSLFQNQIQDELDSYDQLKKKRTSQCKLKAHDNSHSLTDKVVFKPFKITSPSDPPVTTSRAHITIGIAPNVKPKQTGDDLVDIIDLEQRPVAASTNFQQDFKIEHGILRQFGRHGNAFVVYPDLEMIVPGEFNPFI